MIDSKGFKYAVAPQYRYLYQSDQLALGHFFKQRIVELCEEEFGSADRSPGETSLKNLFKNKFSYPLRISKDYEYTELIKPATFKKWITQLANGELDTMQPLLLMHWLSCEYLKNEPKEETNELPAFEEFFVAVDYSAQLVHPEQNVFVGINKTPRRGLRLRITGSHNSAIISVADQVFLTESVVDAKETDNYIHHNDNLSTDELGNNKEDQHHHLSVNDIDNKLVSERKTASLLKFTNEFIRGKAILIVVSVVVGFSVLGFVIYFSAFNQDAPKLLSQYENTLVTDKDVEVLLINAKNQYDQFPNDADVAFEYASLLDQTQQIELAKQLYLEAIRIRPDFVKARNNLARIHILLGQPHLAERELRTLLNSESLSKESQAFVLKNLAWAYLDQNNYLSAQPIIDSLVLDFLPENIRGLNSIVICLQAMSDAVQGVSESNNGALCTSEFKGDFKQFLEPEWKRIVQVN